MAEERNCTFKATRREIANSALGSEKALQALKGDDFAYVCPCCNQLFAGRTEDMHGANVEGKLTLVHVWHKGSEGVEFRLTREERAAFVCWRDSQRQLPKAARRGVVNVSVSNSCATPRDEFEEVGQVCECGPARRRHGGCCAKGRKKWKGNGSHEESRDGNTVRARRG